MKPAHLRRIGIGAIGAMAVAVAVLTATSAQANPITMTVSGTEHYVNSTYTLTIQCDVRSTVAVIDDGEVVSGTPTPPDVNNVAVAQWTPTTTGVHTLVAEGCMSSTQTNTPIQITVTVLDAVPVTPAWQLNATYKVGDVVAFDGATYQCRQAHTVHASNWTPPNTPALWQRL